MTKQQVPSIWLTLKMCVRLLLAVTAVRAGRLTIPTTKIDELSVLFRVECGGFSLLFSTHGSGLSRSDLNPKATRRRAVRSSSSTGTIPGEITPPPVAASLPGLEPGN